MAKAPAKKDEDALPDALEQEKFLSAGRAFASAPRFAYLRRAMSTLAENPPQSLLIEGGAAPERAAASLYWAALLNCPLVKEGEAAADEAAPCLACPACVQIMSRLHRDLFFLDNAAGNTSMEEFREDLRPHFGEAPHEGKKRVVVVYEGYGPRFKVSNALLKSLEDPLPATVFALTAPQRERLLPTLVSRSWILTLPWPQSGEFGWLDEGELAALSDWARALLAFASTGRGWMERTGRKLDPNLAGQLVLYCQNALREALASPLGPEDPALTPLAGAFARLGPQSRSILNESLAESQDSLAYAVNPALVLDWLATRLYFIFARERRA